MKQRVLLSVIFALTFAFTGIVAAPKQTTAIEASVRLIAKEFDKAKGVKCMVLERGMTLGMVKALFNPKFGDAFMKNVTSMVIIEYSEASEEVCNSIRSKIEGFSEQLQEFSPSKSESESGQYSKSYATILNETSISDFMIIIEDGEDKMFLYMGGVLNIDKLKMNP